MDPFLLPIRAARALTAACLVLALAACSGPTAEEHLQSGREYLARGDLAAAEIELKNALQKDPALAGARAALGRLMLRRGDAETAVKELERAVELSLDDRALPLELARARLATGDRDQAQAVLDTFGDDPALLEPEAAALVGQAYAVLGQALESRRVLGDVLERDDDSVASLLTLARLDAGTGDLDRALERARAATETAEGARLPGAWLLLGQVLLERGEAAEAVEAFREAVELEAGDPLVARLSLVRAHLASGDPEAAREVLDRIRGRSAQVPLAGYLDAVVRYAEGDLEGAEEGLDALIARVPGNAQARFLRGLVAFRLDNPERAQDDLERVVAQTPGNLRARLVLAALLNRQGESAEAARVLAEGLNEDTSPDAGYLAALGQSQLRAGDAEAGLRNLARAAELAPDVAAIRTQLALAQLSTGEADAAEAQLRDAVDLSESFPQSDALLVLVQLRDGRIDEALESARAFVERSPDVPLAHNMLGAALLADEQGAAGRAALERALELDPGFAPAVLNLAALDVGAGDLDAARARLVAFLERNPADRSVLRRLGELAAEAEDYEAAIAAGRRAVAEAPQDGVLALLLAGFLDASGDRAAAREVLLDLEVGPDSRPTVLAARAQAALETGDRDEALALYERLLEDRPGNADIAVRYASVLASAGSGERALDVVEDALERDPENPARLLALRTRLLLETGRVDAAEDSVDVLREIDAPESLLARFEGGIALARGDLDRAAERLQVAAEAAPDARLIVQLHSVYTRLGDADRARSELVDWLEGNPEDPLVLAVLAQHELGQGDYDGAVAVYERLNALVPGQLTVLNNLAWLHGEQGRVDRGLEMARRAYDLAPGNTAVLDTLGWLLVLDDQHQDALPLLRQAASQAPADGEIQYHYAAALAGTGARQDALRTLRNALGARDPFPSQAEARALLRELGGA